MSFDNAVYFTYVIDGLVVRALAIDQRGPDSISALYMVRVCWFSRFIPHTPKQILIELSLICTLLN